MSLFYTALVSPIGSAAFSDLAPRRRCWCHPSEGLQGSAMDSGYCLSPNRPTSPRKRRRRDSPEKQLLQYLCQAWKGTTLRLRMGGFLPQTGPLTGEHRLR
ncbi:hypothetical protein GDO78_018295 [Eleutherodactylus coqui]|uniref:Uncharacterized protein n=1 Tax=Eleutherodactylus coqui TaxID=57060 RepID=A0A8J6ENA4_ELECQ|nr:hypothetical protein GDO78_018295 [Eleutherodactylus coqui]